MKKADWRKIRRGDAPERHTLADQPLPEVTKTCSEEMARALRAVASHEEVCGRDLSHWSVSMHTLEALWRRDLVEVKWARVPLHAPISVKVDRAVPTERGRALLAALALTRQDEADATTTWTAPPGVKAVQVHAVGGGGGMGGGGGSGQNGQAGKLVVAWGPGQAGVASFPVTPGHQYRLQVGAAVRGGKNGP